MNIIIISSIIIIIIMTITIYWKSQIYWKFPMVDLGIPHLEINNMLELNPLKSRFLLCGLTVAPVPLKLRAIPPFSSRVHPDPITRGARSLRTRDAARCLWKPSRMSASHQAAESRRRNARGKGPPEGEIRGLPFARRNFTPFRMRTGKGGNPGFPNSYYSSANRAYRLPSPMRLR